MANEGGSFPKHSWEFDHSANVAKSVRVKVKTRVLRHLGAVAVNSPASELADTLSAGGRAETFFGAEIACLEFLDVLDNWRDSPKHSGLHQV